MLSAYWTARLSHTRLLCLPTYDQVSPLPYLLTLTNSLSTPLLFTHNIKHCASHKTQKMAIPSEREPASDSRPEAGTSTAAVPHDKALSLSRREQVAER